MNTAASIPENSPLQLGPDPITQSNQQQQPSASTAVNNKITVNRKKIFVIGIIALSFLFAIGILVFAFTSLSGSSTGSLRGTVVSEETGNPVEQVRIYQNGEIVATTNQDGSFEIPNLSTGQIELVFEAEGFDSITRSFTLNSGLLGSSSSTVTVELQPSNTATVVGQLVSETVSVTFSNSIISIDESSTFIRSTGAFEINTNPGIRTLSFQGSGFRDFELEIEVLQGNNDLGNVTIEPAADITGFVRDGITKLPVEDVSVQVTNVLTSNITLQEDGNLLVQDITPNIEYTVQIDAPGYKTFLRSVDTTTGESELFNIDLFLEGKAFFVEEVGNDFQLFSSDFDGENKLQLTDIDNLNPIYEYFDRAANTFYLLSDHERITNQIRGRSYTPFFYDVVDQEFKNPLANEDNLGYFVANFPSQSFVNVTEDEEDSDIWIVETIDINGDTREEITRVDSDITEISDVLQNNDGRFVAYVQTQEDGSSAELIIYDRSTKMNRSIVQRNSIDLLAYSDSGRILLFVDEVGTLMWVDRETNEVRTITRQFEGENVFFLPNSDSEVYYTINGSPDSSIYKHDLSNQDPIRILIIEDAEIDDIYLQNSFMYYITQEGLFIFDPLSPIADNLISDGIITYNGNFSYNY